MALRWPLEAHFELFWALVPEWFPDDLWRFILSCYGLWWPEWLSDGLWGLILSSYELCWPEWLSDGL